MIDLHCHILPGADDGATTLDEAVAMARLAVVDGVRTIVVTPHYGDGIRLEREDIRNCLVELQAALRERAVEVELLPGAEVMIDPGLSRLTARGVLPTLNAGPYVLVELPFSSMPFYAEQTLGELQAQGLWPIIAHPERCAALHGDLRRLAALVRRGMLVQLNAGSLTGIHGGRVRGVAREMVQKRLAHVVASDGHSALGRVPRLSAAVAEAARLVGRAHAEAMVTTTPAAVVAGQPVEVPEPADVEAPRRRWWPPWLSLGGSGAPTDGDRPRV